MSKVLKMVKFAQAVYIGNSNYNHVSPGVCEAIGATMSVDDAGITIKERNGAEVRVFAANICFIRYEAAPVVETKDKKIKA